MRNRTFLTILTLASTLSFALASTDDNGTPKKIDSGDKTEIKKEKLAQAGDIKGKVVRVDPTKKQIVLQVVTKTTRVPNQGALNNIASLNRQLVEVSLNRNYGALDRANRVQSIRTELAKNQAVAYKNEDETKDFDLETVEEVVVRLKDPPAETDEKGRPKKYTAKELKELKGPGNLWGYSGDIESLKPGQAVRVYLSKKKTKGPIKIKDLAKVLASDDKPLVTRINVLEEPKK